MRDGGEELALLGEVTLDPRRHGVDGVRERGGLAVLVVPADLDPRREVARAELVRHPRQLGHRLGEALGDLARRRPEDEAGDEERERDLEGLVR